MGKPRKEVLLDYTRGKWRLHPLRKKRGNNRQLYANRDVLKTRGFARKKDYEVYTFSKNR